MRNSNLNLTPIEHQTVYNLLCEADRKLETALLRNDLNPEARNRIERQKKVTQNLLLKMRQDMTLWLMNPLDEYTKYRVEVLGKITDDIRALLSLADTQAEAMQEKTKEEKKTATLTVHLTAREAEAVKQWAEYSGFSSASAFIRNALSMVGCGRIKIEAKTDDLQEVAEALNMYVLNSGMLIDALMNRGEVSTQDIEALRRRMDEVIDAVNKCHVISMTERCSLRKKGERYLVHRIDDMLEITKGQ